MISMEFDTEGLEVPMIMNIPYDHPGDPKGSDTVPAWLTPGEFVVNKEATDMYGPVIEKMNDHGREIQNEKMHDGGSVEGGKYHPVHRRAGGDVPMPTPRPEIPDVPALDPQNLYKMLINRGFTDVAARGIIGNFYSESKLDPDAKQLLSSGKFGKGRGLAQWEKGGRFDTDPLNLVDFAAEREKSWRDPEVQLDFMLAEMENSDQFGKVKQGINAAESPEKAAEIFLTGYEKANPEHETYEGSKVERMAYAGDFQPERKPTMLASLLNMFSTSTAQAEDVSAVPTSQPVPKPPVPAPPAPEKSKTPVITAMTGQEMPVTSTMADLLAAARAQYKDAGGEVSDDDYAAQFEELKKLAQQATATQGSYIGDEVLEEGGTNYDPQRHAEEIQFRRKMARDAEISKDLAANEAEYLKASTPPVPMASNVPPKSDDTSSVPPIAQKPEVIKALDKSKSAVGKLFDNEVFTGPDGEYITGPDNEPVFLSEDQSKAVQRADVPESDSEGNFFTQNILGPEGRKITGTQTEAEIKADSQEAIGNRKAEQFGERAAYQADLKTEQSEDYQEMVRRAKSAGKIPMSPSEWRAFTTPTQNPDGEVIEAPIERHAVLSDAPSASDQQENIDSSVASTEVINEGGSVEEANLAAGSEAKTDDSSAKAEEKSSSVAEIIEKGKSHTGPGADQPGENSDATSVEEKGQKEPPEKKNKAVGMLKSLFGDLFDKKELARMAVMYLGSRAMGYSHQGSLGFSAKNYITRVDAKVANRDQFTQANATKFTTESLELYRETGKLSDLVPVGKPVQRKGEYKTFYGEGGKKITGEKVVSGDNTYYVDQNGKVINQYKYNEDPRNVPGTDEYESRVSSNSKDNEEIIKSMKSVISKKDGANIYKTDINPTVEGRKVAEWAIKNGVPIERVGGFVQLAMQDAINDDRQDGSRATSLIPYMNSLVIRERTDMPDLFMVGEGDDRQPVDPEQFAALNTDVAFVMRKIGAKGSDFNLSNQYYTQAIKEFNDTLSDKDRKQYARMAKGTGLSPFMVFVQKDLADYLQKTSAPST